MTETSETPGDFLGPEIDDLDILNRLPRELRAILEEINGFVILSGGFHLRGACSDPSWHSLRRAWEGKMALHQLFKNIQEGDIPFAQDAIGDQFILRQGQVHKLWSETGILEDHEMNFADFMGKVERDPISHLDLGPLELFEEDGQRLRPGQLLHIYPPLCTSEAEEGIDLKAVPADDCLLYLANLARQLDGLEDGTSIQHIVE